MRGGTMTIQNGLKLDLRTEPDLRIKFIKQLVTASWIMGAAAITMACITLPAIKIFLNDFLKLNLSTRLDPLFSAISLGLITATFLVSIGGTLLNTTRNRRRNDHFYKSLAVISILSGISFIAWLALV